MKKDIPAVVFLGILIGIFGWDILWEKVSPFRGDIPLQFYPWKQYTRAMLSQGEIPYWNPYTFGGAPFLANMQSAVFYPLDLLLFLFPMEQFFGLSLLLHLWLAGFGAYFLARICGATAFPALIAGTAYGLNGFTMIHIPAGNHLTYVGAAWVPWMLWATFGFVQTPNSRLKWALAGSLIASLHFLSGHPQMTFYSLVFSVLSAMGLGLWNSLRCEKRGIIAPLIRTGVWGMFLGLGILMAGAQLIPTLEYIGQANRAAALDIGQATEFSFAPHRFITLLFPEFYGTHIAGNHYDPFYYWSCAYAGVMIPFLAIIALWKKESDKFTIPLAGIAGLGLLLACGRGNPIYTAVLHLPGFGLFRAPAKFLPYYLAPVCVLASLGVDRLSSLAFQKQQEIPGRSVLFNRLLMLSITLGLILFYGSGQFAHLIDTLHKIRGTDASTIQALAAAIGGLQLFAAYTIYLLARYIPKYPRVMISVSLTLLLAMDLMLFGRGYMQACLQRPDAIHRMIAVPPEIINLQSRPDLQPSDRVVTLKEVEYPNLFLQWKIPNVSGYDPMSLRSYNRLIGSMEGWKPGSFHDNIQLEQFDNPILDRLNVRYILTLKNIENPKLNFLYAAENFRLYERTSPSRAWAYVAPISGDNTTEEKSWQSLHSPIAMQKYAPQQIVFSYKTEQPVKLRVAEWAYPGWMAEGAQTGKSYQPFKMTTSEEGLRVIEVPPGVWTIRMDYHPPRWGWFITAVCGTIWILLLGLILVYQTDSYWKIMQRIMGRNF